MKIINIFALLDKLNQVCNTKLKVYIRPEQDTFNYQSRTCAHIQKLHHNNAEVHHLLLRVMWRFYYEHEDDC